MSAGKLVPGFEDNQLMWTDSEAEVVISMPIKPEVLRSLSVYTDGENVTLTDEAATSPQIDAPEGCTADTPA